MRGRVEVRFANVTTPLVWGLARPTILLPGSFAEWTPEQQKAAMDHETAHVERGDCWTALIVLAAQAIYWFHPLVWWLSRKLVEQREFAADDRVLASGADATEYAGFLVSAARANSSGPLFGLAMLDRTTALRGRVAHLLRSRRRVHGSCSGMLVAGSLGLLLTSALVLPARARLADEIYQIGGDVAPPILAHKTEPKYTRKARSEKTQGTVLLNIVIGRNGRPQLVNVERSLTPDLDQQAIRAVYSWRFRPATKAGKPLSVRANVEVNFRLL